MNNKLAPFEKCEIELGELLGSGGFSDVYEIHGFDLDAKTSSALRDDEAKARLQLGRNAKRAGGSYAVKIVRESLKTAGQKKGIRKATKHLCNEAHVLGSLDHPNILKMRGLVTPEENDACGIIVDRLEETLGSRITRWNQQAKRFNSPFYRKFRDWKGDKRREFLVERLSAALGIAKALEYLHNRNMIYRDLKPANIGFDADNQPILFDMGLCREMPTGELGEKFEMSGKTGTVRYMSPEVRLAEPYNEMADVYSFGHVLWEILALEKPYAGFSREMHTVRVVKLGERPRLDASWPERIRDLMELSWDADPGGRLTMESAVRTIEEVLADLLSQKDTTSHSVRVSNPENGGKAIKTTRRKNPVAPIESDSSRTQVSDSVHSC